MSRASDATKTAFLFPGQGTQRIGMGAQQLRDPDLARPIRDLSNLLGLDLKQLCALGPMNVLTKTQFAQPAIFGVSVAAHLELERLGETPDLVAGHSVGELAALWAAGCLTLEQACEMVVVRGRLMGGLPGAGVMASIVGVEVEEVARICDEVSVQRAGHVQVGLDNASKNCVITGATALVGQVVEAVRAHGALRAQLLETSHAFHSELMRPAVDEWARYLLSVDFGDPQRLLIVNVTGSLVSSGWEAREALVAQMTQRVEWNRSMRTAQALGVSKAWEVGDSKVLAAFTRGTGVQVQALPRASAFNPESSLPETHGTPVSL